MVRRFVIGRRADLDRFFNFGGRFNPVLVIFYFLFFMVHGFRDVVFFYKPSTDGYNLERTRSLILGLIQVCLIVSLMYLLVPAYFLYRSLKPRTDYPGVAGAGRVDIQFPDSDALRWVVFLCQS